MRYFSYVVPTEFNDNEIRVISEEDVIKRSKMAARMMFRDDISDERLIEDWCVVNYATEVPCVTSKIDNTYFDMCSLTVRRSVSK